MFSVGPRYTLANLEVGSRTVVPQPVRMIQSNEEGRGLTLIPLVARCDVAEDADDFVCLFHDTCDPYKKRRPVIGELVLSRRKNDLNVIVWDHPDFCSNLCNRWHKLFSTTLVSPPVVFAQLLNGSPAAGLVFQQGVPVNARRPGQRVEFSGYLTRDLNQVCRKTHGAG
ncbi:hypothetical protein SBV1_970031 [Verrucomicrobia bacterium]|nr:hypothetical protein SBV1_970031 [Verrucomicrobiota bacterium]